MSLLSVASAVCNETGFLAPSVITTNSDPAYQRILTNIVAAIDELSSRADWRKTLATMTLANGAFYSIPDNFQRLVSGGAVRLAGSAQPVRALNDEEWRLVAGAGATSHLFFRLYNGQIQFSRALTGGESVTVDYVTNAPVIEGSAYKSAVTQDSDTFVFPESLLVKGAIWRVLRMNGANYQDHLVEFEAQLLADYEEDRGFRAPMAQRRPNA